MEESRRNTLSEIFSSVPPTNLSFNGQTHQDLFQNVGPNRRKSGVQGILVCCDRKHFFSLQANSHPEQLPKIYSQMLYAYLCLLFLESMVSPSQLHGSGETCQISKSFFATSSTKASGCHVWRVGLVLPIKILGINASMILSFRLQKGNMGKLQQQNHAMDFILQIFCPSCSIAAVPLRIRGSACPACTCKRHQKTLKRRAMAVTLLQNSAI